MELLGEGEGFDVCITARHSSVMRFSRDVSQTCSRPFESIGTNLQQTARRLIKSTVGRGEYKGEGLVLGSTIAELR